MVKLDPFYLIVESFAWIERLVPLGVKLVQLRIKDKPTDELRAEIEKARDFCQAHECQLVVNDYWQLAIELNCDFVHLGQEDLADADLTAIRSAGLRIGLSTHDHAELDLALSHKPDYVALGPVYPTILKKMKWAPQGLDRLREWKAHIGDVPLVAIGGLNVDRIKGVFDHRADSAAVVTDITARDDPETRTKLWLSATRRFMS
ncbi:thiamine phosphate synthase [Maritalea porphyrae]|uniref:Thiamine-phosphate synthase n=1 Tax=Maritalea porphyrae TaxID=880732 RepID=A0ABQ5UN57_9HYPH|nr:thiamine phosphate synthase [Maritalea porphyrae]GLQ16725.1 thiamine-phosphate synthase [Maritalea porphyrae]